MRQRQPQLQQQQQKRDDGGHQDEPSQTDAAGNAERLDEGTVKVQPPQQAGSSTVHGQAAVPGNDQPDGASTASKHARAKIDKLRSEIAMMAAACSNETDEDFQWISTALLRKKKELAELELAKCQQRERGGS